MHASVYLPLVIAGLFGLTAPRVALRLPPAAATWLLSVGGLTDPSGVHAGRAGATARRVGALVDRRTTP
jgi:hypothetical protein